MKSIKQGKVPRQIVFTTKLNELATNKAKRMGVTVPEYVRFLILQDNSNQFDDIPIVSDEVERQIERSLQEYAKGNYTELKNAKEIEEYFENLLTKISGKELQSSNN